jgi:hypothetical protein
MNLKTRTGWFLIWALVGAPILFGVALHYSYRAAIAGNEIPFFSPFNNSASVIMFALCIVSGAAAIARIQFQKQWLRISLVSLYVIAMIVGLQLLGLYVACSNGNCF